MKFLGAVSEDVIVKGKGASVKTILRYFMCVDFFLCKAGSLENAEASMLPFLVGCFYLESGKVLEICTLFLRRSFIVFFSSILSSILNLIEKNTRGSDFAIQISRSNPLLQLDQHFIFCVKCKLFSTNE